MSELIPDFTKDGFLPEGIYLTTWEQFTDRFCYNTTRKILAKYLHIGLLAFKNAGCKEVYVVGSFVTSKLEPSDYEICWNPNGVDTAAIDPLLTFKGDVNHKQQNDKYKGSWVSTALVAQDGRPVLEWFQQDSRISKTKGIITLQLQNIV